MIRRLRANLLDELQKAICGDRARQRVYIPSGCCSNIRCVWLSIRFISDIGSLLPHVISGAAIVSVVMSLPTTGPMLLDALRSQDMYLAGSFLVFMAFLTVIGDSCLISHWPCLIRASGCKRVGANDRPHLCCRRPLRANSAGGLAEHTADPLPHYVCDAPFDPYAVERMTPAQERFYMASEWRMVWVEVAPPPDRLSIRRDTSDDVSVDPLL